MIHHGDLFDILPTLPESSVDACVTDPPYGIGFMGREWDTFSPAVAAKKQGSDASDTMVVRMAEECANQLDALLSSSLLVSAPRDEHEQEPTDYRNATSEERAMARGFVTLWQSVGVQDADAFIKRWPGKVYVLRSEVDCAFMVAEQSA